MADGEEQETATGDNHFKHAGGIVTGPNRPMQSLSGQIRQYWVGVENRQGILVSNGRPNSITCEIISNVSDAPGNTRICTLQKYISK